MPVWCESMVSVRLFCRAALGDAVLPEVGHCRMAVVGLFQIDGIGGLCLTVHVLVELLQAHAVHQVVEREVEVVTLVVEVLAHGLPQLVGHGLVSSLRQDAVYLCFHVCDEAHAVCQFDISAAVAQVVVDAVA